jgi:hypothetical protein
MPQRTIRFSDKAANQIADTARVRGFTSSTAFIRHAVEQEIAVRKEDITGAEERLAASVEQVRREVFQNTRSQQALFAYLDCLAKTLLTCVPEPPADARPAAVARARERHDRLLKSAGRSMVGESSTAMQVLVSHGSE